MSISTVKMRKDVLNSYQNDFHVWSMMRIFIKTIIPLAIYAHKTSSKRALGRSPENDCL